jgi:hypothetical protein
MKHNSTSVVQYIQNSQMWSAENPHTVHKTPLHSVKIGLWWLVLKEICGTNVFWEDNQCETVPPSMDPVHSLLEENEWDCWFQHDEATWVLCWAWPLATAISRLEPLNFFLQGFINKGVYPNNSWNLEEPKHTSEQTVANGPYSFCKVSKKPTKKNWMLLFEKVMGILASALELFCKSFLTNKKQEETHLSHYTDVTTAWYILL